MLSDKKGRIIAAIMIGPEDIQETPKTNYTPVLILGIAAMLLLIVGFMSYRDYVNAKADEKVKVSNEQIKKLKEQLNDRVGNKPSAPSAVAQNVARDPEIDELRRQLEAMKNQTASIKKQAEENTLKFDRILDGPAPSTSSNASNGGLGLIPPPPGIRDNLTVPEYVRNSVNSPPGGSRSPSRGALTEVEKKIVSAPAIGKIVSYNENWNLVTINAGKSDGIEIGQRFKMRRGSQSLGIVKIFEAFSTQCNANIVTNNRKFDGALKPRAGDDIISDDPF